MGRIYKFIAVLMILLLPLEFAATASADWFGSALGGSITSASNNSSGYYQTQGEDIYTLGGGDIQFSTAGSNVQLFSIAPPSINIGCSGIDAEFGGIALMGQNIINAFKEIMTGAATTIIPFVFNMALGTFCKQCQSILQQIESVANKLNGMNFNSCQAGEALGNLADSELSRLTNTNMQNGSYSSYYDATNATTSSPNSAITTFAGYVNSATTFLGNIGQCAQQVNVTEQGAVSCGQYKANQKFFTGSFLRAVAVNAHIGLIQGTQPGSGGWDGVLGMIRGSVTGDFYGFSMADGTQKVEFIAPNPTQGAEGSTGAWRALLEGGEMTEMTLAQTEAGQPVPANPAGTSKICFPGYQNIFLYYLDEIAVNMFNVPSGVVGSNLDSGWGCGSGYSGVASYLNQFGVATTFTPAAQAAFLTSSTLPLSLILKLAYVNGDYTILTAPAKVMAYGAEFRLLSTISQGINNYGGHNLLASGGKQTMNYKKQLSSEISTVQKKYRYSLDKLNNATMFVSSYLPTLQRAWIGALQNAGMYGAMTFGSGGGQ